MNSYTKVSSYEAKKGEAKRVVLLYSGGLDTSCMLKWIQEEYGAELITVTVDIGQIADDLGAIKQKALNLGAKKALVIDAKDEFAEHYLAKAIKANGSYQGPYYMATALGRPLLARIAVEIAAKENADAIAHGCTGKGNDQVRIEATALTLNPKIKIIAPVREWGMGRDEEIEYAKKHNIPVPVTLDKPYSYDENMWGSSAESGEIEDPAKVIPLKKALQVCTLPEEAPDKPEEITIGFERGVPVSLNGNRMKLAELIAKIARLGAAHGIGIVHHIEDRLVGLKIRDLYEMPAAHIIITAHRNLEKYVSTRQENYFKETVDNEWAHLCYTGLWYEPLMDDLNAFINKMNEKVTGTVRLKLYKGNAEVIALESPNALYDLKLATFMKDYTFNQNASPGFIELWSLQ
ncbi:MAG TPA: argininosuccinate synthase, partial [Candidatus Nanoarchaeia archaeon]|nr:argininosuccinate synthase [Candidatus Nanoarchaeia archaeon]